MCSTRVDPPIHVVPAPTVLERVADHRPAHPNGRSCAVCGIALSTYPEPGSRWCRHAGRNLCIRHYEQHERAGTLDQFPRATWRMEELVHDAELIRHRRPGWTWPQVAEALGVSFDALEQARTRYNRLRRARGEPIPYFPPLLSGAVATAVAERNARRGRSTY